MTFDEWWEQNAKRYYASETTPKRGWAVDLCRDVWNAALAQRPEARSSKAWSEMTNIERVAYNLGYSAGVVDGQQRGSMNNGG